MVIGSSLSPASCFFRLIIRFVSGSSSSKWVIYSRSAMVWLTLLPYKLSWDNRLNLFGLEQAKRPPAAEFRDVARSVQTDRFAQKSFHVAAVFQFQSADAERRGNFGDE